MNLAALQRSHFSCSVVHFYTRPISPSLSPSFRSLYPLGGVWNYSKKLWKLKGVITGGTRCLSLRLSYK